MMVINLVLFARLLLVAIVKASGSQTKWTKAQPSEPLRPNLSLPSLPPSEEIISYLDKDSIVLQYYESEWRSESNENNDPDPVGRNNGGWYRGRGRGRGEEYASVIRRQFELEDAATSNPNPWFGALTGTTGINWQGLTSDSQGVNLFASSYHSGIKYSNNGGNSWSFSAGAPSTSVLYQSIVSSSTGQFVVAAYATLSASTPGQLWTSINFGQSFTQRYLYGTSQSCSNSVGCLAMSSDGTKVIAAVFNLGVLLYNLNADGTITQMGTTLTLVGGTSVSNIVIVSTDASFTFLAFGIRNGGIYSSSNSGSSWMQSDAPIGDWRSFASSTNGKYIAASRYSK